MKLSRIGHLSLTNWLAVAVAVASFVLIIIIVLFQKKQVQASATIKKQPEKFQGACGKEDAHVCGAQDPVSDPEYNMKNIAKQSILLEEHLAEDRKYCKDCCVKHFLHIIGLAEEALWLSGKNCDNYPFLKDSVDFYNRVFDQWVKNKMKI